ncbi:ABC transporter permease [Microbacterium sp. A204]|uniref:ABC transporter permease n=1 Tax=Microbacterium sp. A204 TaxID=3457321 RepID=UPI003FD6A3F3
MTAIVDQAPAQAGSPVRRSRWKHAAASVRTLTGIGVLVALLFIWQIAASAAGNRFFPPPLTILANTPSVLFPRNVSTLEAPFFTDVLTSLGRMAAGFLLGTLAGVLLGALIGWFGTIRDYVTPIVEFLRSIPATAVLPIFIMLLGLGSEMQILFIAWGVSWFVLINTAAAVAEIHPTMLDFCRTFRLSRPKIFFGVVLPSASPKIFAGMRIGLTAAMILFVTSEFMGSTNGIGFMLIQTQSRFQVLDMWAWMVVIAVAGFLANSILEAVEARVLRWHSDSKRK